MKDIKAIFDIWNDSIKTVVLAKDHEEDIILFKHIQATKWMRKGKFLDLETFTNTIWKIVEKIAQKLWWDFIDEVFVWISHPNAKVIRISESKRIMQEEILEEDVHHLSKIIADIANQPNYETVKIIPVSWIVDETKKERDPVWLKGKRLELVADTFMLPKTMFNWLKEAFDNIGLSVVDFIPNIIASSEVALDYDRKDLGSILVDIGKNQTSYSIYEDWYCLGYGTLPIGWEDVTKDISIWMQIDISEAEEIKKNNWLAFIDKNTDLSNQSMDLHFLSDIISARYEEIFEKINNHLQQLGKDWRLPGGVVLIWWASKMQNLDILAKNVFKLATFKWAITHNNIWDLWNNPQFVNVLWCFIWSNKYIEWRKTAWFGFNLWWIGKSIWNFFKDLF